MKKALITGVSGMDGSTLSDYLLGLDYEVHGIIRRTSNFNSQRIDHLSDNNKFILHHGDICDASNMRKIIDKVQPDEVYNLGSQSHVGYSYEVAEATTLTTGVSVLHLLEAIKESDPSIKYYQASSSEMFGGMPEFPIQSETTPFNPRSPYAIAKMFGYWTTKFYRDTYDIFSCNGILFNHEGTRRGIRFVTRKITYTIAQILAGKQKVLSLGWIDAKRDWGLCEDYIQAMHMMLQHPTPDDYVIGTGETHTVREFVEEAFRNINVNIEWRGTGIDEEGFDSETGDVWVKIDPKYFRPSEVEVLCADASKARNILGWQPKTTFKELVKIMMDHDLKEAEIIL